jgi:hypothetical protein
VSISARSLGPDDFTGEFYQPLRAEIILVIYNVFQKIEAKGALHN